MGLDNEKNEFQYGICLNSCECQEINERNKTCKIFTGDLVKIYEVNQNSLVLTLFANECKLYTTNGWCFSWTELNNADKLFKYLNAIVNLEERLYFFNNIERREFVLHLDNESEVNVDLSHGKQIKALFQKVEEKEEKIFIDVVLLESPSPEIIERLKGVNGNFSLNNLKYALPANMIRTFDVPDKCLKETLKDPETGKLYSSQKDKPGIFRNTEQNVRDKFGPEFPENDDQNLTTRNLQENLWTSENVQNCSTNKSFNKASNDEPENTFNDKKSSQPLVGSSTKISVNSLVCAVCFCTNVCDGNICRKCGDETEKVSGQHNSQTNQKILHKLQHCFDKTCNGYILWEKPGEERPIVLTCNKCKLDNCLKCEAIHVNLTCEQYAKIKKSVDKKTVEVFRTWIREGTAMPCPQCEALIEKDEGCDWVQCNFCSTEICWATRGPRWGPGGNGDTSAGCRCNFNILKCTENCNYCH